MSGFFQDDRNMYIPLSVDNVSVSKQSYFLSNRKVVEMAIWVIPYLIMLLPLLRSGIRVLPLIIVTIGYALAYTYVLRFRILEERRLKKMVGDLDANRFSGIDYIWGINKIGSSREDDGVIYYERTGSSPKQGVVVSFDRGSTVAVSPNTYRNFRKVKADFLRKLAKIKCDFHWREMPVREVIPNALIAYINTLQKMDNEAYRNLLRLQIEINRTYIQGAEQRYNDYIVIMSDRVQVNRRIKQAIQEIITETLGNSETGYIQKARILNKNEVEAFFGDLLMVNTVNSDIVRKGQLERDFEHYAKVTQIIDRNGREVPPFILEQRAKAESLGGESIEGMLERKKAVIEKQVEVKEKQRESELRQILENRNKNRLADKEYRELRNQINAEYDTVIEKIKTGAYQEEAEQKRQEELAKREYRKKLEAKIREAKEQRREIDNLVDLYVETSNEVVYEMNRTKMVEEEDNFDYQTYLDKGYSVQEILEIKQRSEEKKRNRNL